MNIQRLIPLEGAYNMRDLGGYPTEDGGSLRWRQIFRADALHRLTKADLTTLTGLNIRTAVDLRFRQEAAAAPSLVAQLEGVNYQIMPMHDDPVAPTASVALNPAQLPQTLDEYYRMVLDHCQRRMKSIFDVLLQPGALPGLFHCTAGKDRTGMVAMLLLLAVGVPREIVVEDYLMTAEYAAELLHKLDKQMYKAGVDIEWNRRMLDCSPRPIQRVLDHLERQYGGARSYLQRAGVSLAQLQQLKDTLVEPVAV